jgi:2-oxo-4-hydroxy-4-carboxy-5-ureidoimidazoline decarboxylase
MSKVNYNFFNGLESKQAKGLFLQCCGSHLWVDNVCKDLPFSDATHMHQVIDGAFNAMTTKDWLEAFAHHPMIGDVKSIREKFASTAHLASNEQSGALGADEKIFAELADYNKRYFAKFGFIFIIFATGKSAESMLSSLKKRFGNDADTEVKNAAAEQRKITWLRLEKVGAQ